MPSVVLGLGSNQGDSLTILREALETLRNNLDRFRAASFYQTKPMHVEDQPPFLNTACAGIYEGTLLSLLERIHQIEAQFGRNRSKESRWGPRTLDIDILFAGAMVCAEPHLTVPHPRLYERRFALEPLLELEPYARDPVSGKSLAGICAALPSQDVKKMD